MDYANRSFFESWARRMSGQNAEEISDPSPAKWSPPSRGDERQGPELVNPEDSEMERFQRSVGLTPHRLIRQTRCVPGNSNAFDEIGTAGAHDRDASRRSVFERTARRHQSRCQGLD